MLTHSDWCLHSATGACIVSNSVLYSSRTCITGRSNRRSVLLIILVVMVDLIDLVELVLLEHLIVLVVQVSIVMLDCPSIQGAHPRGYLTGL